MWGDIYKCEATFINVGQHLFSNLYIDYFICFHLICIYRLFIGLDFLGNNFNISSNYNLYFSSWSKFPGGALIL